MTKQRMGAAIAMLGMISGKLREASGNQRLAGYNMPAVPANPDSLAQMADKLGDLVLALLPLLGDEPVALASDAIRTEKDAVSVRDDESAADPPPAES